MNYLIHMEQKKTKTQEVQFHEEIESQNQENPENEYADLAGKKSDFTKKPKKFRRQHKQSNCILKKESRLIAGKNNLPSNTNSIKWDNKAIDEQNQYRRNREKMNKKMKSQSQTKFLNYADDGDLYIKNLNKLNQLKFTDDCLKNIMNSLDQSNKLNYKNQKCSAVDLKENIEDILTKEGEDQVFDQNLDCESKITLKNTLLNKFHREVRGNSFHTLPENNLNLDEKEN